MSNDIFDYIDNNDGTISVVRKPKYVVKTPVKKKGRVLTETEILNSLYIQIKSCGKESKEFINPNGNLVEFVTRCDNRSCSDPDCMKHRLYKYKKAHFGQIVNLNRSMRKPKAWVFTGWKYPIANFTRDFLKNKMRKLNNICKEYSSSDYSIHMEIKFYSKRSKSYGLAYLHFHVVSGGFKINLKKLESLWYRKIRYEKAIVPKQLGYYVSKYASKTPYFEFESDREFYHLLVYKMKMHSFSTKNFSNASKKEQSWFMLDLIRSEIFRAYKYDYENKNGHFPYCDEYIKEKKRRVAGILSLDDFG